MDNFVATPDQSFNLKFVVDRERDKQILFDWDWNNDPAGLKSRAAEKGISYDFACRLRDASSYQDVKEELDQFVDSLHDSKAEQVQAFINDLEKFWSENLGLLTDVTVKLTERPFYYTEYHVLVSVCHMGMVSGGVSNDIGVGITLDPEWRNRILAHELVEEHWRKLFREEGFTEKLGDWGCWALSEIAAVLVLKDDRLKPLWSKQQQEMDQLGYFARSNYPQLAAVEKELRDQFSRRVELKDFLEHSAGVLAKYSSLQESVK